MARGSSVWLLLVAVVAAVVAQAQAKVYFEEKFDGRCLHCSPRTGLGVTGPPTRSCSPLSLAEFHLQEGAGAPSSYAAAPSDASPVLPAFDLGKPDD